MGDRVWIGTDDNGACILCVEFNPPMATTVAGYQTVTLYAEFPITFLAFISEN